MSGLLWQTWLLYSKQFSSSSSWRGTENRKKQEQEWILSFKEWLICNNLNHKSQVVKRHQHDQRLTFWLQRGSEKTPWTHQGTSFSPHMLLFSASTGESFRFGKNIRLDDYLSILYKWSTDRYFTLPLVVASHILSHTGQCDCPGWQHYFWANMQAERQRLLKNNSYI